MREMEMLIDKIEMAAQTDRQTDERDVSTLLLFAWQPGQRHRHHNDQFT